MIMARRSDLELPADSVTEILLRLPVKSIIRFKSVAKTWYHLFKSPTFVSQHLSLSKTKRDNSQSLLVQYFGDDPEESTIGMLSFADDQTFVSWHDFHQEVPSHLADWEYISCALGDGLICFYDCSDYGFSLWNPATRDFRILPDCPREDEFVFPPLIGCGVDPLSNDYKVLYIQHHDNSSQFKNQYAIYRMSDNSWRVLEEENDVESVKNLTSIDLNNSNVCVNGICYWVADRAKVLTFNLSAEVFRLLSSPVPGTSGELIPLHDGRISFWDSWNMNSRTNPCAVWVLNDEENWIKLINIDPLPQFFRIYGFWTSGKVFVEGLGQELLLYDLETREFSEPGFEGLLAWVYPYKESLIVVNRE